MEEAHEPRGGAWTWVVSATAAAFTLLQFYALGGYALEHPGEGGALAAVLSWLTVTLFATGVALCVAQSTSRWGGRHASARIAARYVWPLAVATVVALAAVDYPGQVFEALFFG